MKVDIFDFELDKELIAKEPAEPRDSCKLLDLSVEGEISDRIFTDLPDLLQEGDVLVFNDTKVIPAKLYGRRGEAEVEVTLYRPVDGSDPTVTKCDKLSQNYWNEKQDISTTHSLNYVRRDIEVNHSNNEERVSSDFCDCGVLWWSFIKNAKRLKIGDTVTFYAQNISPEQSEFKAEVIEKKDEEGVLLHFTCEAGKLGTFLEAYGSMPLPPYIKREKLENRNDKENYQTIYAKHEGAVAAPTAGLHFTPRVMEALKVKGIKEVFLTLHVGAGTFLPVKVEDTENHKMHSEYGIISQETCDIINDAKNNGKRIIAVGTTSLRLLESASDDKGIIHPFANDTNIFITPGYKFKMIDMIITNFHLPKSTLFMLICAISGTQTMQEAYKHAQEKKYHFYSYGDSSILKCVNKI